MSDHLKVELLLDRPQGWVNRKLMTTPVPVKRALPYVRTTAGTYIHRLRSAQLWHQYEVTWWEGRQIRTSLLPVETRIVPRTWCGVSVGSRRSGEPELFAVPPDGQPVCATCEGRAVGAGMPSNVVLEARAILFRPRVA